MEELLKDFDAHFTKPDDTSGDDLNSHDNNVWWEAICEARAFLVSKS